MSCHTRSLRVRLHIVLFCKVCASRSAKAPLGAAHRFAPWRVHKTHNMQSALRWGWAPQPPALPGRLRALRAAAWSPRRGCGPLALVKALRAGHVLLACGRSSRVVPPTAHPAAASLLRSVGPPRAASRLSPPRGRRPFCAGSYVALARRVSSTHSFPPALYLKPRRPAARAVMPGPGRLQYKSLEEVPWWHRRAITRYASARGIARLTSRFAPAGQAGPSLCCPLFAKPP